MRKFRKYRINCSVVMLTIILINGSVQAQCDRISGLEVAADTTVFCSFPSQVQFSSLFELDTAHVLLQSNYPPSNWQAGFSFTYDVGNNGCLYYLQLAGSLTLWGNNNHLDAWSKFNITTNLPYANSIGLDQFLGAAADIEPIAYNPVHIYDYYYFGDGTGTTFSFSDFPYWDNFGLVTFDWYAIPCFEYQWDFGDGQTSNEVNSIHTYNSPGTYEAAFTITDVLSGCSQTASITIGVYEPIPVEIWPIDDSYCVSDEPVELSFTPPGGSLSGIGISGENFNPSIATIGGPYALIYSYEDINGCVSSDSIFTSVSDLPEVSLTGLDQDYCESHEPVLMQGSPLGGQFEGTGVTGNQFDPGDTGSDFSDWITYEFVDENGCANSDSIYVAVHEDPQVEIFGLDEGYCADHAAIQVEGFPVGGDWLSGPVADGYFDPGVVVPEEDYEFSYSFTTEFGCVGIANASTFIYELPSPDLGPNQAVCFPAQFTLFPGYFEEYLWNDGDTMAELPTSLPGVYHVEVWDDHGCTYADTLEIKNTCYQPFYVPNAFTPDNDGVNDVFKPILKDEFIEDYQLTIVNRWGETIFQSRNLNDYWDGGYGTTYVEPGTYVWIISFLGNDEMGPRAVHSSGVVNVIR